MSSAPAEPRRSSICPKKSQVLDTVLDSALQILEFTENISDSIGVPGLGVTLKTATLILKKIQVCANLSKGVIILIGELGHKVE